MLVCTPYWILSATLLTYDMRNASLMSHHFPTWRAIQGLYVTTYNRTIIPIIDLRAEFFAVLSYFLLTKIFCVHWIYCTCSYLSGKKVRMLRLDLRLEC